MSATDVLLDGFDRVEQAVTRVLDGLSTDQLVQRVGGSANSIAWLVWHLTRVQDDHVADLAGTDQAWVADGWAERFDLPLPVADTGYGHDSGQVAAVVAPAELLLGYHRAVHERTASYLRELKAAELSTVVDESWDPPVTRAVRLVSVIEDDLQHAGQAAFVRGLLP
ncbi:DinB family protein [Nocardia sp. NRRL S-836]|uniref:mycothiol transferase n=1 Tax=Nocardia sp. NRRL S-836 TaxID=1519492 RepID=UPI0026F44EF1|nr:DinB family protein [Nocardia sp. NRRL S-836]